MGSSCCHAKSPCGSADEISGLLKDDSNATMPTGKSFVVGACGPEGGDHFRMKPDEENVEVKKSPATEETNDTQENGPLKELVKQTATPSPRKRTEVIENITRVQEDHTKEVVGDGQAELPECTLNSLKEEHTDVTVPEGEDPASAVQDKIPDISLQTAEAVCHENHVEINPTTEHTRAARDNDDGSEPVVAEASGQFCGNTEALSLQNAQLSSRQEIDRDSPSCAATQDSQNESSPVCQASVSDHGRSHDICELSSQSDSTALDRSHEEADSAHVVGQPEAAELGDRRESSKLDLDTKPVLTCATTRSLENIRQHGEEVMLKGQDKDGDVMETEARDESQEEAKAPVESRSQADNSADLQEVPIEGEQLAGGSSTDVKADRISVPQEEDEDEDEMGNSEEDLYRGDEELSTSHDQKTGTLLSFLKVEDRCSLAPAMDILSYSEREWKGNTAKSALIRKGYKEMSQTFGSVRRVRGDNYCALRATLFQVFTHSTQLPSWLQDVTMLPNELEAQEGLISGWTFPGECLQGGGTGDATLQLKGYMELLQLKWQAAVDCSTAAERQQLCERLFQGGEEELGLLEALKLLMLARAVELHGRMQAGGEVPLFCWLLFARDSSGCPRSFLSNHLSHVGLSAGLEQVEMFLLGYALQCTIQVYRLYKADTEEFVTYYPDDHKDDWPSVCLVTEDDRHYNVPVVCEDSQSSGSW